MLIIREATKADTSVINNLLQLYLYDLAAIAGKEVLNLNSEGLYVYPRFDAYWEDKKRYIYLVQYGGDYAGLVLVHQDTIVAPSGGYVIGEFGILRTFQRRGLGLETASRVFAKHRGFWEMRVSKDNLVAQKFWAKVLKKNFKATRKIIDKKFSGGGVVSFYTGDNS